MLNKRTTITSKQEQENNKKQQLNQSIKKLKQQ